MPGGRPTKDPKTTLVAVRLADRQVQWLRRHAATQGVTLSEALRRILEQHLPSQPLQGRPPTAKERKEFDQVFAAFGLVPRRRPRRRKR